MNTPRVEDTNCESTATSREEALNCIAKQLCEARKKENITIDTAAHALKLRKIYLEALESGDWSDMPGEVYAIGFLRQYADYLHLDLGSSIEKLKSGQYQFTKPLTFPDPPIAPAKKWALAALLLFIVLFIGFNSFDESPAPLPSQLMQESAQRTLTPTLQLETNIQKSVQEKMITKASEPTIETPKDSPIAVEQPQQPTTYTYQLKAVTGDVWLQLHEAGNPPVLIREALLKKGQVMKISHNKPLLLDCGNALALQIDLNGKRIVQAGSLGKKNKVLHAYALQPKTTQP